MWELYHKAEHQRIDASELWCWRRLLRVPWTVRRSSQSILRNIHWKDWYWSWRYSTLATWCKELTHWKDSDAGKDWRQKKGMTEDEMFGWHHRLNGHEFEQTLGVGDGQGGLVCCSPWGHKESDTTERLNWTESPSLSLSVSLDCWSSPTCPTSFPPGIKIQAKHTSLGLSSSTNPS